MTTAIFDLDQQRIETQDAIALELFINGESDAFDGIYPASPDSAYMTGYSQGLRRKMADLQRQAEMLEAEGLAVEAMFEEELVF